MAVRYFIVVDDPTTAGGRALEGFSGWQVECIDGISRNVVRVGDPVLCGKCGPTTAIQGYPFAFFPGGLLAYDNSELACGHRLVSKLQRLLSWSDSDGKRDAPPSARTLSTSWSAPASPSGRYDEQIQFVSQRGAALSHLAYTLLLDDGRTVKGRTDAQGRTERVSTEIPQQIVNAQLTSLGAPCCAQRFDSGHVPEHRTFQIQQVATNATDVGHSVQQVELPEGKSRGLTVGEIGMARAVFGDAIDYQAVKVHNGGYWLFAGMQDKDTAVTPNGEMYWPAEHYRENFLHSDYGDQHWFMHEMAHVWQYQMGYPVVVEGMALHAKKIRGIDPYDYTLMPGTRLCQYNMEQQANILSDYYLVAIVGGIARRDLYGKKYMHTPNIRQLLENALADFLLNPRSIGNLPPLTQ